MFAFAQCFQRLSRPTHSWTIEIVPHKWQCLTSTGYVPTRAEIERLQRSLISLKESISSPPELPLIHCHIHASTRPVRLQSPNSPKTCCRHVCQKRKQLLNAPMRGSHQTTTSMCMAHSGKMSIQERFLHKQSSHNSCSDNESKDRKHIRSWLPESQGHTDSTGDRPCAG